MSGVILRLRSHRLRLVAAFLLGAISVLGFAPFGIFPLPLVALAGLLVLWRGTRPSMAALIGYAFGCGFFLAGVSWVYVSMHEFGGMSLPLAGLAAVLFCGVQAIYPALTGLVYGRLASGRFATDVWLFAGAWTLSEWLRGWVLTGFPWLALGYAQTPPSPLAGYAPLLGVYGVGLVSALIAGLMGLAWHHRERASRAVITIVTLLAAGYGLAQIAWTEPVGKPLRVSLLQGNIEQSLKWRPERLRESLTTYLTLARAHPADLIVLPETAVPLMLDQLPQDYIAELRRYGDVLLGAPTRDEAGRYFNSAVVFDGASPRLYSKRHLVPFGEFTPPAFAWTLALLHIPMSDFSAGSSNQSLLESAGQKIAVNICYEDVFGEEIIRALPEATLLVNMSNTAWFGDSLAQPQHLQIAQMRALETGRTMLRATNTGMTAIVTPHGRIERVLPPFTAGALFGEAQGYSGATPYVRWGNAAVLFLIVCAFASSFWSGRRKKRLNI